jgi:hypothetical protein
VTRFPYPTDPDDVIRAQRHETACTCKWEDDPFDPPLPVAGLYLAALDEACEHHGRDAQPETWARLDLIDAEIEAAVAARAHDDDCPMCGRPTTPAPTCDGCGIEEVAS